MQLPGEFTPFIEKNVVFCLVVGGVTPPPTPLVVRPIKKNTFFMCVFPYLVPTRWPSDSLSSSTGCCRTLLDPPALKIFLLIHGESRRRRRALFPCIFILIHISKPRVSTTVLNSLHETDPGSKKW